MNRELHYYGINEPGHEKKDPCACAGKQDSFDTVTSLKSKGRTQTTRITLTRIYGANSRS